MPTVLITGANRGLGLEFARQYLADRWRVIACCRKPAAATTLAMLAGEIAVHPLDVADPASIEALGRAVGETPIDVLINNAGIYGGERQSFRNVDYAAWSDVFRVNVMGPMRMIERLAENVARSERKLIVCITSQMGSITEAAAGSYAYSSSKAALNYVGRALAQDLVPRKIAVILMHPGWVRTDMGGSGAPLSPQQSVTDMRSVIGRLKLADSGRFLVHDGSEHAW